MAEWQQADLLRVSACVFVYVCEGVFVWTDIRIFLAIWSPSATTDPPVGGIVVEASAPGSLKIPFPGHTPSLTGEAAELFIAEESRGIFHPNTEQSGLQSYLRAGQPLTLTSSHLF